MDSSLWKSSSSWLRNFKRFFFNYISLGPYNWRISSSSSPLTLENSIFIIGLNCSMLTWIWPTTFEPYTSQQCSFVPIIELVLYPNLLAIPMYGPSLLFLYQNNSLWNIFFWFWLNYITFILSHLSKIRILQCSFEYRVRAFYLLYSISCLHIISWHKSLGLPSYSGEA